MDEILRKGKDAAKKEEDEIPVLEVAYEMCARGYEFAPARLGISDPLRFLRAASAVSLNYLPIR